ncbi:hypothetical protein EXIGLDRAFT_837486 [Exidia glandulosa HHB12029]|uniref:Transmembrane protein n=1 Tax=Exidia glandulosa HHB12029 TaxID=1314781 RepID=A0A165GRS2_EXIGL|nr:hypothetical protein EXIGLDRAFT_837486 [Exidia glandulosa HHB12029]
MSLLATNNATSTGSSSSLAGIIATKPDLVPSIIFIIAFTVLAPLAAWRLISTASRSGVLIRPAIFSLIRIGTYVVRAIEANGNYSTGIVAAELVLLNAGTILLAEPLIELIKRLLETHIPYNGPVVSGRRGRKAGRQDEVGLLSRVLKVALLAMIAISIYSSTQVGDAFKDPDAAKTVVTTRKISAIILVAVLAIAVLGLLYFHIQHRFPSRALYFLLVISVLLEVTAAYRLASAAGNAGVRNHTAFWLASSLPEWLVTAAFFSTNINTLIPSKPAQGPGAYSMTQQAEPHHHGQYPDP